MKKLTFLIIMILFLIESCHTQSIELFLDSSIQVDKYNVPINNNQYYFPLKLFPKVQAVYGQKNNTVNISRKIIENESDTFVVKWYSEQLYAMKEPLLFNRKTSKEIYRFTWLRTFHNPVAIRIEKENNEYKIFLKVCDGAGGYDPGKLIIDKIKTITQRDWQNFKSLLSSANFWNMKLGRMSIGEDGADWILEGVDQTRYKVVSVWSPGSGKYYDACSYLLSLTELEINEKDKY